MYCNQCGHELSEREKFCTVCGEVVEKLPEKASFISAERITEQFDSEKYGVKDSATTKAATISGYKRDNTLNRKAVIIFAILALAAIVGVYLIITSFSHKEQSIPEIDSDTTEAESPSQGLEETALPYDPTIQMEEVEGIVLEIRDRYNGTQAGLEQYSTTESGQRKTYINNGEIVLVSDFSDGVTNYYYSRGELYFIVITGSGTQDITRLYFCNDELVRFIDPNGTTYDLAITYEEFIDMCKYIDRAYTVYDEAFSYIKASNPELLFAGNAATDEEICEAIVASSQMKLIGKTYDQLVSIFGSSTGAVLGIESPARFSFSNTNYTFNFDGGGNGHIVAGRSINGNGAFSDSTYSGEEVDTYFDHDAKCCEVQNVQLDDIISVPEDGFVPDESIFGQYIDETDPCYWIQYKGYTFSISADYDRRVYPDSTVCLYGDR